MPRGTLLVWLAGGAVAALLGALLLRPAPPGHLALIAPPIPGDCWLMRGPGPETTLIDGCADPLATARWLGAELPLLQRRLERLILTNADPERLPGALAVARRYRIDEAWLPAPTAEEPQFAALLAVLNDQGTRVIWLESGLQAPIPGGLITILDAGPGPEAALLQIDYGGWRGLLAPAPSAQQHARIASGEHTAHLLVYPWASPHGRAAASGLGALALLYGEAPSDPPLLATLRARGSAERRLLHEALHGRIEIHTDGASMTFNCACDGG